MNPTHYFHKITLPVNKTVQQAGPWPAHPCRNLRGADRGPWAVGRIDAMG